MTGRDDKVLQYMDVQYGLININTKPSQQLRTARAAMYASIPQIHDVER